MEYTKLDRGDIVYKKNDRKRGVVCEVEGDRGTVLVRFDGIEKLYRLSADDLEKEEK
jgi:ribosomal protein L35AE/L33A